MKSLAIRGVVLLVLASAFAVPAFASPSTSMSETTMIANLVTGEQEWIGDFAGTLVHPVSEGRAGRAYFSGCVADGEGERCGDLVMLLVVQWAQYPWAPGLEGKWVILEGSGDLETLRGQGNFVIDWSPPLMTLTMNGQYHFDPDQGS